MKSKPTFPLLIVILLAACMPVDAATQPPLAQPEAGVSNPMPVPVTDIPAPTEMTATQAYTDSDYGFAFDYPAAWMLDVVTLGDRAPHAIQLTSWTHEPGLIAEVQSGGTVVNIVVQLWDPKGDLQAFAEQRAQGWDPASVVAQEALTLSDGRAALEYILRASDGESYFFFTLLGDQYLVISGSGDVASIRQLARSLR